MDFDNKVTYRTEDGKNLVGLGYNFEEAIERLLKKINKRYGKSYIIKSRGITSSPQARRMLEDVLGGDISVYVYNKKLKRWI